MNETAYLSPPPSGHPLDHHYGDNVHILSDAWALSLLARIGHPDVHPPLLHDLIASAYSRLARAVLGQLPTHEATIETRMTSLEDRARYTGTIIDPTHPVVVVDVARAGILPSLVVQRAMLEILEPSVVRADHIYMQRVTDPETNKVIGVDLSGSKIGGPVDNATVIIPDPMGATGSSIARVVEHYEDTVPGKPARIVTCHLYVTPEYLRHLAEVAPQVHVFTLRVDRGLSGDDVLGTRLGERWPEERGLSDHDYIVPGAGGMGEVINNAFV